MDYLHVHQFLRFGFVCLSFVFIVFIVFTSIPYLYPFYMAFLLAWLIQPFIKLLEKRFRLPRVIAVLFIMLLLSLLSLSLITLLIAEFVRGLAHLSHGLPGHAENLIAYTMDKVTEIFTPLIAKLESVVGKLNQKQQHSLFDYLEAVKIKASNTGAELLNNVFTGLTSLLASLPGSLATILFGVLATFFIAKDWDKIMNGITKLVPDKIFSKAKQVPEAIKQTIGGVVRAQLIMVAISTAIIGIGLSIIHVPYAVTITLFAALVDFVPYIGTGVIFLPWVIYQFLSGEIEMAIALISIYVIVLITRQVLEPKLLSVQFGVPPILLLISLFAGFQLFGVYGIIISPFLLVLIKTMYESGILSMIWFFIKGTN
ncbi:sporulation integral membrane protein YtvI [Halobacillus mangrovi]|uniref:Sporulation integral membrane protein YtvI n=1 Tax=Halobacillus mangrovi TaxID=402384 RepID=A0A1W5ZU74_9BACI|nr:sporulation integral membrane protein YtvI [Halobacillus mangrovi]ARI76821.1 sporulation integral membrane protein YtvI [Halobacillus mangrovi]